MSKDTKDLKPCPFCGGKAKIFSRAKLIRDGISLDNDYYISCCHCDSDSAYYGTEAEAIAAWNKRAFETSQGSWQLYEDKYTNAWECSVCDSVQQLNEGTPFENHWYFCPHCGAKMEQEIRPELDYDGEESYDEQE